MKKYKATYVQEITCCADCDAMTHDFGITFCDFSDLTLDDVRVIPPRCPLILEEIDE